MQVADAVGVRMREAPNIVTVQPPALADDHSALLWAMLAVDPKDMAARDTIDWIAFPRCPAPRTPSRRRRTDRADQGLRRPGGADPAVGVPVRVGDRIRDAADLEDRVPGAQGRVVTVLSVAAAYGHVVPSGVGWRKILVSNLFQSLEAAVPRLVLAITFGLSMDYENLLVSADQGTFPVQTNNTRDAVAWGVSTSARTVTSAALIMIAVYIGFAFTGMPLVAEIRVPSRWRSRSTPRWCESADRVDGDVRPVEVVVPAVAGSGHLAVGRLRTAAAQGRHRRRRQSSRTTFGRWW